MSDLGRYPYYIDTIKAMLKLWYRVEHLECNSLLYNALVCPKEVGNTCCSWFSTVKQLSSLLHLSLPDVSKMKKAHFNSVLSKTFKKNI